MKDLKSVTEGMREILVKQQAASKPNLKRDHFNADQYLLLLIRANGGLEACKLFNEIKKNY